MGAAQGDEKGVSWNAEPDSPLEQPAITRALSWISLREFSALRRLPGRLAARSGRQAAWRVFRFAQACARVGSGA